MSRESRRYDYRESSSCSGVVVISQKAGASAAGQCKAEVDEGCMVPLMRTLEWSIISRKSLRPHNFYRTPLARILPNL